MNAHPDRLDLTDAYCRTAKDEGVLLSIASDAHSTFELNLLQFGIGQARRGWIEGGDVLNTRALSELKGVLSRRAA